MTLQDTIAALDAFVPTGEEHEDIARLVALTDQLETIEQVQAATPALLRIFERHPHALLGSPGPVVHCIERSGLETFLPMLLPSFTAHPSRMTLWMLERCLRSSPAPQSRPPSFVRCSRSERRREGPTWPVTSTICSENIPEQPPHEPVRLPR